MSKKYEDTRQLPVALTEHELLDFGQQLARANVAALSAENVRKNTNAQLKADVDAKEAQVERLTNIVASREEVRAVKCRWTMNLPKPGKKSLIRLDTQAVVEMRDMVGDDMQPELDPVVAEAEAQPHPEAREIEAKVVSRPLALPAPGKSKAGKKAKDAAGVDWEAVKAFYLETRSIKKTAERFGLNENTLKTRVRKEKWALE